MSLKMYTLFKANYKIEECSVPGSEGHKVEEGVGVSNFDIVGNQGIWHTSLKHDPLKIHFSCVATTPNPDIVAVVLSGKMYLLDTAQKINLPLNFNNVIEILQDVGREALLAISPWDVFLQKKDGSHWISDRLAIDGFESVKVEDETVILTGDLIFGEATTAKLSISDGSLIESSNAGG